MLFVIVFLGEFIVVLVLMFIDSGIFGILSGWEYEYGR